MTCPVGEQIGVILIFPEIGIPREYEKLETSRKMVAREFESACHIGRDDPSMGSSLSDCAHISYDPWSVMIKLHVYNRWKSQIGDFQMVTELFPSRKWINAQSSFLTVPYVRRS
jgi:hypothetical protein